MVWNVSLDPKSNEDPPSCQCDNVFRLPFDLSLSKISLLFHFFLLLLKGFMFLKSMVGALIYFSFALTSLYCFGNSQSIYFLGLWISNGDLLLDILDTT